MKKNATRVTVDLLPEAYARLQRLTRLTESPSQAETIRKALREYEAKVLADQAVCEALK